MLPRHMEMAGSDRISYTSTGDSLTVIVQSMEASVVRAAVLPLGTLTCIVAPVPIQRYCLTQWVIVRRTINFL